MSSSISFTKEKLQTTVEDAHKLEALGTTRTKESVMEGELINASGHVQEVKRELQPPITHSCWNHRW